MPAKRARTTSKPPPDAERELVGRLTSRLSRADLEALVVAHVCSRAPLTRVEIEARLPERLQSRDVQRVKVRAGASREGTGLFDVLDDELLVNILAHLRAIERVRAVTRVCKSWRGLRGSAELFAELDDAFMSLGQLSALVEWLPTKGTNVRSAYVSAQKKVHAKAPTALLANLASLTALTLSGPKITANALAAAVGASGARLKSLRLSSIKMTESTRMTQAAMLAAAKQLPALEELALPGAMLSSGYDGGGGANDCALFRALAEARGGGTPLVRRLLVGEDYEFGGATCDWLHSVGRALPELEVLRVGHGYFHTAHAFARLVGPAQAWAPLPRVRELALCAKRDFGSGPILSTAQLGAILGLAFGAAARLEVFELDAGTQWVSCKDRKHGRVGAPQPALAGALHRHAPPSSLRALTLRHVDVTASDFADLDLPHLGKLVLHECGAQAAAAAAALAAQYPAGALACALR